MAAQATKWRFTAHIRTGTDEVLEVSGVFIGTHVQAYDHVLRLAYMHGGPVLRHELRPFNPEIPSVVCTTPVPQLPPPPPTKEEEPTVEQVAWFITVPVNIDIQEFTGDEYKH